MTNLKQKADKKMSGYVYNKALCAVFTHLLPMPLHQKSHSFGFNNSLLNTVLAHFPWSILHVKWRGEVWRHVTTVFWISSWQRRSFALSNDGRNLWVIHVTQCSTAFRDLEKIWWVRKTFLKLSTGAFQFALRKFCLLTDDDNENVNSLTRQKNVLHVHHAFLIVHFFAVTVRLPRENA